MKKILVILFLFFAGWIVYFQFFLGKSPLGIDAKNPIGSYEKLYERLSHTRFQKEKKDIGNGLQAIFFTDERANKAGSFREKVVLIFNAKKKVKGVVVHYIPDASGLYKTPASQFLIKYWKKFNEDQPPEFESKGPDRFNMRDIASFSKNGAMGSWIGKDDSKFFAYAYFYPASAAQPDLFPGKNVKNGDKKKAVKKEVKKADAEEEKPKKKKRKKKRRKKRKKKTSEDDE